ncbi:MAG: ABC transporter permease subunit [Spirochaetaceae bacterium]|nr:ABC transporter permease subunit [Spirochaetaceae bacterium]
MAFPWFFFGIVLFLVAWEVAAWYVGGVLLLPGPLLVLKKFFFLATTRYFLTALGHSCIRVILGVLISAPLGIAAGIGSGLNRRVYSMLGPLFSVISATPVMSVILIAFLWFGQERTPVFTAFLMVFPVMAANTIEGIKSVDPGLVELFQAYRITGWKKLFSLYLPSILPFILGGLRSGLSLCWKVVVAAEVLVQPFRALGTGMQNAKAQLETAELFAWTAGTVCAAALSQGILSLIITGLKRRSA